MVYPIAIGAVITAHHLLHDYGNWGGVYWSGGQYTAEEPDWSVDGITDQRGQSHLIF